MTIDDSSSWHHALISVSVSQVHDISLIIRAFGHIIYASSLTVRIEARLVLHVLMYKYCANLVMTQVS